MSTSATPKSVLIGNTANMKPTYSAKVPCEKEKEFSTKDNSRSRGESQQILYTFLDAFLLSVTLH